jgi:hypothetical protein
MISFLQNLSMTGVLAALAIVMLITPLVHRAVRFKKLRLWVEADEIVVNYVQMMTVFYGLLLGLAAVDLWQKQDEAEKNTVGEANQIRIVLDDLLTSAPGDKEVLRNALADYVQAVLKKEWPMMLDGKQQEMFVASPELDNVRSAIMELEPKTMAEQVTFQEILGHYNEITVARQRRLLDSQRSLPIVLRATLIIGAFFTWFSTFFIPFSHPRSHYLLSSITAGYLFLLLYLILVLEHPFVGAWRVDARPYEHVLEILR